MLILDENLNILNNINAEDGLETGTINVTYIDSNDKAF